MKHRVAIALKVVISADARVTLNCRATSGFVSSISVSTAAGTIHGVSVKSMVASELMSQLVSDVVDPERIVRRNRLAGNAQSFCARLSDHSPTPQCHLLQY